MANEDVRAIEAPLLDWLFACTDALPEGRAAGTTMAETADADVALATATTALRAWLAAHCERLRAAEGDGGSDSDGESGSAAPAAKTLEGDAAVTTRAGVLEPSWLRLLRPTMEFAVSVVKFFCLGAVVTAAPQPAALRDAIAVTFVGRVLAPASTADAADGVSPRALRRFRRAFVEAAVLRWTTADGVAALTALAKAFALPSALADIAAGRGRRRGVLNFRCTAATRARHAPLVYARVALLAQRALNAPAPTTEAGGATGGDEAWGDANTTTNNNEEGEETAATTEEDAVGSGATDAAADAAARSAVAVWTAELCDALGSQRMHFGRVADAVLAAGIDAAAPGSPFAVAVATGTRRGGASALAVVLRRAGVAPYLPLALATSVGAYTRAFGDNPRALPGLRRAVAALAIAGVLPMRAASRLHAALGGYRESSAVEGPGIPMSADAAAIASAAGGDGCGCGAFEPLLVQYTAAVERHAETATADTFGALLTSGARGGGSGGVGVSVSVGARPSGFAGRAFAAGSGGFATGGGFAPSVAAAAETAASGADGDGQPPASVVSMTFLEPRPRWSVYTTAAAVSSGGTSGPAAAAGVAPAAFAASASRSAPLQFVQALLSFGAWEETARFVAAQRAAGLDWFLAPAPRLDATVAGGSVLPAPPIGSASSAALNATAAPASAAASRPSTLQGILMEAVLGAMDRVHEQQQRATAASIAASPDPFGTLAWHRAAQVLYVAGSHIAVPVFLSQCITFFQRRLDATLATVTTAAASAGPLLKAHLEWAHEAKEFISLVALPSLRVLPPLPSLAAAIDALVLRLPLAWRALAFAPRATAASAAAAASKKRSGAAGAKPAVAFESAAERVAATELRALLAFCLSRVTPEDTKRYAVAILPVAYRDPALLAQKLAQQAVSYYDSNFVTLLLFGQILREAPPLAVKAVTYACVDRAAEYAREGRDGSDQRVMSLLGLLAILWRNNASHVDAAFVVARLERALARESREDAVFAVSLLRALLSHFVHAELDHAEHWSAPQLAALCAPNLHRFFATGSADSFLHRWNATFTPHSLERNWDYLRSLFLGVGPDSPTQQQQPHYLQQQLQLQSAQSAQSARPLGIRLLLALCRWQHRLTDIFADLPGLLPDVLLFTLRQLDAFGDLALQLAALLFSGKPRAEAETRALFADLATAAEPAMLLKLLSLAQPAAPLGAPLPAPAQAPAALPANAAGKAARPRAAPVAPTATSAVTSAPTPTKEASSLVAATAAAAAPVLLFDAYVDDAFTSRDGTVCGVSHALFSLFWTSPCGAFAPVPPHVAATAATVAQRFVDAAEAKSGGDRRLAKRLATLLGRRAAALEAERADHTRRVADAMRALPALLPSLLLCPPVAGGPAVRPLDATSFVHHCLLPRCRLSHEDALGSIHFLRALVAAADTRHAASAAAAAATIGGDTSAGEASASSLSAANHSAVATAADDAVSAAVSPAAVRRTVATIVKTLLTAVCSFFVSFSPGEIRRFAVAASSGLSLLASFVPRDTGASQFDFFPVEQSCEASTDLLYTEAYLCQALHQILCNRTDVPHFAHQSVFAFMEAVRPVFPQTALAAQVLQCGATLHAHRNSPSYAAASSAMKHAKGVAATPLRTLTPADEATLKELLRDEIARANEFAADGAAIAALLAAEEEAAAEDAARAEEADAAAAAADDGKRRLAASGSGDGDEDGGRPEGDAHSDVDSRHDGSEDGNDRRGDDSHAESRSGSDSGDDSDRDSRHGSRSESGSASGRSGGEETRDRKRGRDAGDDDDDARRQAEAEEAAETGALAAAVLDDFEE